MQLSKKQKIFSEFVSKSLKATLSFEHFQKKMILIAELFPNLRTRKTWLKICLKSPVAGDPLTSNVVIWPNTVETWTRPPLPYLLITVKAIELEKVFLSEMQNLTTVC